MYSMFRMNIRGNAVSQPAPTLAATTGLEATAALASCSMQTSSMHHVNSGKRRSRYDGLNSPALHMECGHPPETDRKIAAILRTGVHYAQVSITYRCLSPTSRTSCTARTWRCSTMASCPSAARRCCPHMTSARRNRCAHTLKLPAAAGPNLRWIAKHLDGPLRRNYDLNRFWFLWPHLRERCAPEEVFLSKTCIDSPQVRMHSEGGFIITPPNDDDHSASFECVMRSQSGASRLVVLVTCPLQLSSISCLCLPTTAGYF